MGKLKLIPWFLGICLLVFSLGGARRLLYPDAGAPDVGGNGGGKAAVTDDLKKIKLISTGESLVQPGTVDSELPRLTYFMPSHMQAATVAEVLVKDGQDVKPNDVMLRFDSEFLKNEAARAEIGYQIAYKDFEAAESARKSLEAQIEAAKIGVRIAEATHEGAVKIKEAISKKVDGVNSERTGNVKKLDPNDEPEYVKASAAVNAAALDIELKKKNQAVLESRREELFQISTKAAKAAEEKQKLILQANLAVSRCEVRAEIAGRVERVEAVKGMTVGPQTRTPLLYIVPEGPRLVRVRVVPEFASRVHDKVGRAVKIYDESNLNLVYDGTVERVGSAFLPERSGTDLINKPAMVLEVIVRVTDPHPTGKPPLLVGQPVRVNFQ